MAAKLKFKKAGFRKLLKSPEVKRVLLEEVSKTAAKANQGLSEPGFAAATFVGGFGGGRVIGTVRTITEEGRNAEATDKVLTRAINGG